ncbi:cobalt chelatase [Polaromonas sp.]|uniref:cobaltochelatase CobT-related protein n=1 Tax=Polaromonas sp. TaxID=1869339 RepID=UPI0013BC3333|nr:cobalt chelatase [Polaromonas sp.]NDP62286.1 cobalt chelatase [Polaromonas sp.]
MVEHPAAASATRHQQRIDDLCAATIRALSGQAGLHFRGRRLFRNDKALPPFAPHLSPKPEVDDFSSFRGAADAMALRLQFSDAKLHKRLRPTYPMERMLFEMLEQFRVEALAPTDMPGMAHNLRHRFEAWSMAFYNSGLTETSKGILLYTVAQITRSRVTAQPVVEATEDAIEATRMSIVRSLGHDLAGLRRQRFDQAAYAEHALSMASLVAGMLAAYDLQGIGGENDIDTEPDDKPLDFNLWMDFDSEGEEEGFTTASSGNSRSLAESGGVYRVFTDEFDTEVDAATLVRAAVLEEYRERLDQCIEQQGLSVARLARELNAVLATPVRDGWIGGQEEGYIDGRQLSQLITSPAERRLFRIEQHAPVADSAVSFLIDCSGSMREHIESVAVLVDVMARALDQIGVTTEVLGFTTNAWNGGRAQKAWMRAGRPPHPGRLNEAAHLIFKDSDTPWRRARPAMGALLKSDLFREGVDGEAVAWAAQRLVQRHDGRRLLMVISDGSPTDGATTLANDAHYLDHHLCNVVAQLEAQGQVEIYGIGVGLDLSPYYRNNRALDLSNSVTNTVLREIVAMTAAGPRR